MSTLSTKHWQELSDRLAKICKEFRFRWLHPSSWGDDEVEVAAYPDRDDQGQVELVISVTCGLRLRPALRGFRWAVFNARSGEQVCAGDVLRCRHFSLRELPAGDYRVAITPLPVEKVLPSPPPFPPQWPVVFAMAAKERGRQVLAPLHGEILDPDATPPRGLAIDVQFASTPSNILVLEVRLNPVPERTRLARFTIRSGDRKHLARCYVGLGDDGTGEIILSAFDYQLETSAVDGWEVVADLVTPGELQEGDREDLRRSLEATPEYAHPRPIQQALEQLPGR